MWNWSLDFLFNEMGFEIIATDISKAMLSLAKSKQLPNVTFSEADVCQLPFSDKQFDQVAVITALEFCGNIDQAFAEIKRVLKPEGWLIAGCLNADSILGEMKDSDPVLKHGNFMSSTELENHLNGFGQPAILECVHLSPDLEILDHIEKRSTIPGSSMAAAVQNRVSCISPLK